LDFIWTLGELHKITISFKLHELGRMISLFFQYRIILDNFLDIFDNDIDIDNFYHSITFIKT